jgi:DNA-binding beta-propeller fold protein YncE
VFKRLRNGAYDRVVHGKALAGGFAVVTLLTACSGSAGSHPRAAATHTAVAPPVAVAAPPVSGSGPACSQKVAAAPPLRNVRTGELAGLAAPWGVVSSADGRWAFASVTTGLAVLSTTGFEPKLVRTINLTGALGDAEPEGLAITPNGQDVLLAEGTGAVVFSVARAESGSANPVLGALTSSNSGGTMVAISPDSKFAFVSIEYSNEVAVYNLAEALAHGFGPRDFVGNIPLNETAVGMAVSPDGRWLYATTEQSASGDQGTLSVIDLAKAEADPAKSVVATVDAGCSAVRVITSANGDDVWVAARESDALLLFSAAKLVSDPAHALLTWIRVGEAPVDLALVRGGTRLIVGNSNRFNVRGQKADLSVVNVADVLAGKPAVLGSIGSGLFPRQLTLEPNGKTLLVANYNSDEIESVDVADIP